jgi:putative lipoic acid-binding regulatory protein
VDYSEKIKRQKELLDQEYDFPCEYLFKFIVPTAQVERVKALFPNHQFELRPSKKGNYMSISVRHHAESSDLVLAIYEKAALIEGLIAL